MAVLDEAKAHRSDLAAFLTRRVGCATLAEDLTQEAYLKLAALPSHVSVLNPRAYLFRIAERVAADHWRASTTRRQAASTSDAVLETAPHPGPDPEAALLSKEELAVLAAAINDMPAQMGEVFRLARFEGLSYTEIGDRLGIARNTVMVHMTRALARLRDRLQVWREGG